MKVEDNEKMRKLARISAGAAQVIRDLTSGFSVREERASRRSQGTGAYVHLVKSIWTTISQALTSAMKEQPSSLPFFLAVTKL